MLAICAPEGALAAPANDAVADAVQLNGSNINIRGNNSTATSEPGESQHAGVGGGHTLWYRWTAPASGPAGAIPCGPYPSTVVAVYTATGPVPPMSNLSLVGADTGSCGTTDAPLVSFTTTAGDSYLIVVDSAGSSATGDFSLSVSQNVPSFLPGADSFADATILNGSFINLTTSNVGATAEAGEPTHAGAGTGHSIWFRWTANVTDSTFVFACGSIHAVTAVYTQNGAVPPFTNLQPLAGAVSSPSPSCSGSSGFTAQAGQEYVIAVDGTGAVDQGDFIFGVQQGLITPGVGVGAPIMRPRPSESTCKKAKKRKKAKGSAAAKKKKKKKGCKPRKKRKPIGRR